MRWLDIEPLAKIAAPVLGGALSPPRQRGFAGKLFAQSFAQIHS
jgi:hypothetical protein